MQSKQVKLVKINVDQLNRNDKIYLYKVFENCLNNYLQNVNLGKISKKKKDGGNIDVNTTHKITLNNKHYQVTLNRSFYIIPYKNFYLFVSHKKGAIGKGTYGKVRKINTNKCFYGAFDLQGKFHCDKSKIPNHLGIDEILKYKTDEYLDKMRWQKNIENEVDLTNLVRPDSISKPLFINDKAYLFGTLHKGKDLFKILNKNDLLENYLQSNSIDRLAIFTSALQDLVTIHKSKKIADQEVKIVHLDLKPQNMVYDVNINKITIIDYGLSAKAGKYSGIAGSCLFIAPEIIDKNSTKKLQSMDIFSMGVCFISILGIDIEKICYPHVNVEALVDQTKIPEYYKSKQRIDHLIDAVDKQYSNFGSNYLPAKPIIINLIKAMLSHDPDDRPTAEQTLQAMQKINQLVEIAKKLENIKTNLRNSSVTGNASAKIAAIDELIDNLFNVNNADDINEKFVAWESRQVADRDQFKNNLAIIATRRGFWQSNFWSLIKEPDSLHDYKQIKSQYLRQENNLATIVRNKKL